MELRINRQKLPVKYALEVFQELSSYPSQHDYEYLLVSTLENSELLGKEFVAENIWPVFRSHMGTLKDCREFLENTFNSTNPNELNDFNVKGKKLSKNSYIVEWHRWV
jgi:hypothetical protein